MKASQRSPHRRQEDAPGTGHAVLTAGVQLPQLLLQRQWATPEIQRLLRAARQRFGHALCSCRPQPLKLQLRLRGDKVHLAVWPHEHPAHDTGCLFFHEPLAATSAARDPLAAALARAGENPGAAPSLRPVRIALWTGPSAADAAAHGTVTVQTLALRLWEAASLCRWHPGWSRDWGRTRYQLLSAAAAFSLNGVPLEQLLFVPRPYRQDAAAVANQAWAAFATIVRQDPARIPRLLVAPLRRLRPPGETGAAMVWLRHLRAPLVLRPACWDFVSRHCRPAIANSRVGVEQERGPLPQPPGADQRPELVGFFLVGPGEQGTVQARAGWLLPVHPVIYIPAANGHALWLVDALRADGHVFERLPSVAAASHRNAPDLLVRHVLGPDGRPVARAAIEVLAASAPTALRAARDALAHRMAGLGIPTWRWTPTRGADGPVPVPALPPPAHWPPALAAERLQGIAAAADASYGFGPTDQPFAGRANAPAPAQAPP